MSPQSVASDTVASFAKAVQNCGCRISFTVGLTSKLAGCSSSGNERLGSLGALRQRLSACILRLTLDGGADGHTAAAKVAGLLGRDALGSPGIIRRLMSGTHISMPLLALAASRKSPVALFATEAAKRRVLVNKEVAIPARADEPGTVPSRRPRPGAHDAAEY